MSDPIQPPAARQPEEALELVSQALSDGDLEAALAQYEGQARLVTWRRPPAGPDGEVRSALTCFMALRLPLAVQIATVLRAPGVALVICERRTTGTGPDGEHVRYRGSGCAVVRAQPDGTWRIAADAWHLGTEIPLLASRVSPALASAPTGPASGTTARSARWPLAYNSVVAAEESAAFELGTDGPKVILVGVDDSVTSLRAAAYAAGLARRQGARLVCVYVEQLSAMYGAAASAAAGAVAAQEESLHETAADLRRRSEEYAASLGVRLTFITACGDPFTELRRVADEVRADAVIVGASAKAGHRWIGSLAVRLVKAGRWPVTVVP